MKQLGPDCILHLYNIPVLINVQKFGRLKNFIFLFDVKLIKSDSKGIYNFTKYFIKDAVLLNFLFIKLT